MEKNNNSVSTPLRCFALFHVIIALLSFARETLSLGTTWNTDNRNSNLTCNQSYALAQIKGYLEREDFSEIVTDHVETWINPETFWNNVVNTPNICDTWGAVWLQKYCWIDPSLPTGDRFYGSKVFMDQMDELINSYKIFGSHTLTEQGLWRWPSVVKWSNVGVALSRFPLQSGKMAVHFCELVKATEPTKEDFDYSHIDRILFRVAHFRYSSAKRETLNFGRGIRERLEKEGGQKHGEESKVGQPTQQRESKESDNQNHKEIRDPTTVGSNVTRITSYNSPQFDYLQEFSKCSGTCRRLTIDHRGTFFDIRIMNCCFNQYKYRTGHCIQHVPKCTDPVNEGEAEDPAAGPTDIKTPPSNSPEFDYLQEFSKCSVTCRRLTVTRTRTFTDPRIVGCCSSQYNYTDGHCIQHVPKCTSPANEGEDAAHPMIVAKCKDVCYPNPNPENSSKPAVWTTPQNCCQYHGYFNGVCDVGTIGAKCWGELAGNAFAQSGLKITLPNLISTTVTLFVHYVPRYIFL